MNGDVKKRNAARAALAHVKSGMRVGLGTGSTASIFIELLAEKNRAANLNLTCIPTSLATAVLGKKLGLRMAGFDSVEKIDIAFDGADVVTPRFNLLKGLGGALTREKIVAYRAAKFVAMVDDSKLKPRLEGPLPVEVLPFAFSAVARELASVSSGGKPHLRMNSDNTPFRTDNGNYLIHVPVRLADKDAAKTEREINGLPGVVENGIFTRADVVIVGEETGAKILINKKKFDYPALLKT